MQFKYDERTNKLVAVVSDKDLGDANLLKQTMETDGWKVLERWYDLGREEINDAGKKWARDPVKKENCSNMYSMLDGFDQARVVPFKIVKDAEIYIDQARKEKKEFKDATKRDDYGDIV